MAGNLFMRAFERSDRIYMAMVSRGYDGEVRAMPLIPLSFADRILLICGVAILIILVAMSYLVWS
jgi:cobalt/nickel transport system permease protein